MFVNKSLQKKLKIRKEIKSVKVEEKKELRKAEKRKKRNFFFQWMLERVKMWLWIVWISSCLAHANVLHAAISFWLSVDFFFVKGLYLNHIITTNKRHIRAEKIRDWNIIHEKIIIKRCKFQISFLPIVSARLDFF